ncbi:MAG: ECF transporter S component [Eubacteriales bacterium]|jgi:uncharacterized membrane protein|nr:ECF transporter S component [Eubacteriales bacterium]
MKKKIALMGVLCGLTFVFTSFIKIPISAAGYVHLGNVVIVVSALMLGPLPAAIIGAAGSALADLLVAPVWTLYTVVIKFALGYLVSVADKKSKAAGILLYVAAGVIFVGGYYLAECIIFGNWVAPLFTTPQLSAEYILSLLAGLAIGRRLPKQSWGL